MVWRADRERRRAGILSDVPREIDEGSVSGVFITREDGDKMSERQDGGPAFPVSWQDPDGQMVAEPGMSLREWFAGQALIGLIKLGHDCYDQVADNSYRYANAMLAEREKPKQ